MPDSRLSRVIVAAANGARQREAFLHMRDPELWAASYLGMLRIHLLLARTLHLDFSDVDDGLYFNKFGLRRLLDSKGPSNRIVIVHRGPTQQDAFYLKVFYNYRRIRTYFWSFLTDEHQRRFVAREMRKCKPRDINSPRELLARLRNHLQPIQLNGVEQLRSEMLEAEYKNEILLESAVRPPRLSADELFHTLPSGTPTSIESRYLRQICSYLDHTDHVLRSAVHAAYWTYVDKDVDPLEQSGFRGLHRILEAFDTIYYRRRGELYGCSVANFQQSFDPAELTWRERVFDGDGHEAFRIFGIWIPIRFLASVGRIPVDQWQLFINRNDKRLANWWYESNWQSLRTALYELVELTELKALTTWQQIVTGPVKVARRLGAPLGAAAGAGVVASGLVLFPGVQSALGPVLGAGLGAAIGEAASSSLGQVTGGAIWPRSDWHAALVAAILRHAKRLRGY